MTQISGSGLPRARLALACAGAVIAVAVALVTARCAPPPPPPATAKPRAASVKPRAASVKPRAASAKPKAVGSPVYALRIPQVSTLTGVLVLNGRPLHIVEQRVSDCNGERGINSDHAPLEQLPSRDCLFGEQCLAFEGFAARNRDCGADRIEVTLGSSEEPSGLHFGETVYLQFFIRIDPRFETNTEGALISQVWQQTSVAYGGRPALGPGFSILLVSNQRSNDVVDLEFRSRAEVSEKNPLLVFERRPITKGEWHSVRLELTPRYVGHPDGPGRILIWLDQGREPRLEPELAINYDANDPSRYRFYWGYPPDPKTLLGSSFDVRVGIYRAGPYTWLKFGLDGVVLTRNKAELSVRSGLPDSDP